MWKRRTRLRLELSWISDSLSESRSQCTGCNDVKRTRRFPFASLSRYGSSSLPALITVRHPRPCAPAPSVPAPYVSLSHAPFFHVPIHVHAHGCTRFRRRGKAAATARASAHARRPSWHRATRRGGQRSRSYVLARRRSPGEEQSSHTGVPGNSH